MNRHKKGSTSVEYSDIEADIEPWIDFAINLENYDGLERMWAVLGKAGLTKVGTSSSYEQILLMTIALIDFQGHLLQRLRGAWMLETDYYSVIEETTGDQIAMLRRSLNSATTEGAQDIAHYARYTYLKTPLDALMKEYGDEYEAFEVLRQGVDPDDDYQNIFQLAAAFEAFDEVYTSISSM
jgi:hypothetical protein